MKNTAVSNIEGCSTLLLLHTDGVCSTYRHTWVAGVATHTIAAGSDALAALLLRLEGCVSATEVHGCGAEEERLEHRHVHEHNVSNAAATHTHRPEYGRAASSGAGTSGRGTPFVLRVD